MQGLSDASMPPKEPPFDTQESWPDRDAGAGCSEIGPIEMFKRQLEIFEIICV